MTTAALTTEYTKSLVNAIAAAGHAQLDPMMGSLYVQIRCDAQLYATPGWEGVALSWCVCTDCGAVPAHGEVEIAYTGDLQADVELYRVALETLVAAC